MSGERSEPFDAGDPQHVRERMSVAKRREAAKRSVIREVMAKNIGRDWIYEMLSLCHVYSSSFDGNALRMAYLEGERNVGLRMMADVVQASPDRYLEMLAENGDKNV
jgi:hypothetical protein